MESLRFINWYYRIPEFTEFKGTVVLISTCSVRSNCLLYLVVVSIAVLSHPILRPVSGGRSRLYVGEGSCYRYVKGLWKLFGVN